MAERVSHATRPARRLHAPDVTDEASLRRAMVALLTASTIFTFALGTTSTMDPHRMWAQFAVVGYGIAACMLVLLSRPYKYAVIGLLGFCVAIPTVVMIERGLSQHEVAIVADGARRIVESGSPYVDAPHTVGEVFPYFPLMSVFGLPSALLGDSPLGDPRVYFGAFFAVTLWYGLSSLIPSRAAAIAVAIVAVCPLVAIPISTGGVDLPVAALAGTVSVSIWKGDYRRSAVIAGIGCAIKFTFWPLAVMMLVILVRRRCSRRQIMYWIGTALAVFLIPTLLPAALEWNGFVRSAIMFPAGLSDVESPAGTSVIGGPLADHGVAGSLGIIVILASAATLIAWTTLRSPRLGLIRMLALAAAGYSVLFLVAPISRPGYFILPFVLLAIASSVYLTDRMSPEGGGSPAAGSPSKRR